MREQGERQERILVADPPRVFYSSVMSEDEQQERSVADERRNQTMHIVRRSFGRLFEALPSQVHDRLNQRYGHHVLPDLRPHLGPTPWAPLRQPLSEATVGLFTTAGIHLRSQPGFTSEPDPTWRVIPRETPDADLMITHDHYDHQDADRDPGIVFPLDLLRQVSGNLIGRPAADHYGMMGFLGVHSQWRRLHRAVRALAEQVRGSDVDVAVLTPG
jgi:D-proline reductase (dithiol) PrdB